MMRRLEGFVVAGVTFERHQGVWWVLDDTGRRTCGPFATIGQAIARVRS